MAFTLVRFQTWVDQTFAIERAKEPDQDWFMQREANQAGREVEAEQWAEGDWQI